MSRSNVAVEVNKFNLGLVTDRSPLTSLENSSLDEENFILNLDGSRQRRLGMGFESDYSTVTTTTTDAGSVNIGITTHRWDNAGGDPAKSILVVQMGKELKFFDMDTVPLSDNLLYTKELSDTDDEVQFSYAVVDGILVVTANTPEIHIFEYDAPSTFTYSTRRLKIRDLFGVEDVVNDKDLTSTDFIDRRPTSKTDAHIYNLRNQSFGVPRIKGNTETQGDPIEVFRDISANTNNRYPSNSDTVNQSLFADPDDSDDRVSKRFFARNLYDNPLGSGRAAQGYYIIDLLERGESRLDKNDKNEEKYSALTFSLTTLPTDSTPNGASVCAEFAGRLWYGGFSGEVVDGDAESPRLSSYVLFSKVVDSVRDINKCFQENDPTSPDFPDLLDTDGGFIRLNGAYGILGLVPMGASLIVLASNGIWRVFGGTENGFTASNYIVQKLSDKSVISKTSITVVNNTIMFWGDDGIYHINVDENGAWRVDNIAYGRIQTTFNLIALEDKKLANGIYDGYRHTVRWLYQNRTTGDENTKELVFDLELQAFYIHDIKQFTGTNVPKVVSHFTSNPFNLTTNDAEVTVQGDDVIVGLEDVVISVTTRAGAANREIGYIAITDITTVTEYTFCNYNNTSFRDWEEVDEEGLDASAYLVTNYTSGNDFQRDKQVPYITCYLRRTETGFDDSSGAITPVNQSSCLMQSMWEWTNSAASNKWGRQFQVYRYRRLYSPSGADDPFDSGQSTIISKNKLRGNGRVLSLKWETEPYRDCHLYGWSMVISIEDNEVG